MIIHVLGSPTRPLFSDEACCQDTHPGREPVVVYHPDAVKVIAGDSSWWHCLACDLKTRRRAA